MGTPLTISQKGRKGIHLQKDSSLEGELGKEGYFFESGQDGINIKAAHSAGLFYGIQTLRQLLPPVIESASNVDKIALEVPALKIKDKPRFSWRAFMLDDSRHFKGKEQVKKMLEQMALLKMNVFHWHLVDDQGWRIEIKKYPLLTTIGAKRKDSQIGSWQGTTFTGEPHSGHYTQADIKEIIRFADERHITIIPEIEMPGHGMAAMAAYPWLGTLGTTTEVPIRFGKMKDSYKIADPKVVAFLKDVLTEVMELFPGNIIHIGGDEVDFDGWKKSKEVQQFMKEKGLESPSDLQISFTNGIAQFLTEHGHRMMGWNEIAGGEIHEWQESSDVVAKEKLSSNAIVHFWKGDPKLISETATRGYDMVNSYHLFTYLDYDYESIPLEKAFHFDPVPEELAPELQSKILGLGCQMWSELLLQDSVLDRQVFPRIAAYATVGWNAKADKDYVVFRKKLMKNIVPRWDLKGIEYYRKY